MENCSIETALDFAYNHGRLFDAVFYDFEMNKLPELEKQEAERQEQLERSPRKPEESIASARDRILAERERWKIEHGIGG